MIGEQICLCQVIRGIMDVQRLQTGFRGYMNTQQPRRQHLIDTALHLFNEYGYHATGIDRILQEAGVSKATLYKHFRSKEDLILAVLQQRHEDLVMANQRRCAEARDRGESTLFVIFDALHDWFQSQTFFGCNFIKASSEYAQTDDPIHQYAAKHKEELRLGLKELLLMFDKKRAEELADQLMILIEGSIVSAQVRGDKNAARKAKKAAQIILSSVGND